MMATPPHRLQPWRPNHFVFDDGESIPTEHFPPFHGLPLHAAFITSQLIQRLMEGSDVR